MGIGESYKGGVINVTKVYGPGDTIPGSSSSSKDDNNYGSGWKENELVKDLNDENNNNWVYREPAQIEQNHPTISNPTPSDGDDPYNTTDFSDSNPSGGQTPGGTGGGAGTTNPNQPGLGDQGSGVNNGPNITKGPPGLKYNGKVPTTVIDPKLGLWVPSLNNGQGGWFNYKNTFVNDMARILDKNFQTMTPSLPNIILLPAAGTLRFSLKGNPALNALEIATKVAAYFAMTIVPAPTGSVGKPIACTNTASSIIPKLTQDLLSLSLNAPKDDFKTFVQKIYDNVAKGAITWTVTELVPGSPPYTIVLTTTVT